MGPRPAGECGPKGLTNNRKEKALVRRSRLPSAGQEDRGQRAVTWAYPSTGPVGRGR